MAKQRSPKPCPNGLWGFKSLHFCLRSLNPNLVRNQFAKLTVIVYSGVWVRVPEWSLWQRTLIGKKLVWKTSVGVKADGGSSPLVVALGKVL